MSSKNQILSKYPFIPYYKLGLLKIVFKVMLEKFLTVMYSSGLTDNKVKCVYYYL